MVVTCASRPTVKDLTDFIGEGHHEREYKQATTVFH